MTSGASINPKTGLPKRHAALCYWRTIGKQWIFQSREPKLTRALKSLKNMRVYMRAITGGHLFCGAIECKASKARSIVRSMNRILREHQCECVELSGREGGK